METEGGEVPEDDWKTVSVKALRKSTVGVISSLLNPTKVLPTDAGLSRDWRGLADLVGISGQYMPAIAQGDKTESILSLWCEKNKDDARINKLFQYFEELDRYDVEDDVMELAEEDVKLYKTMQNAKCEPLDLSSDKFMLTRDDMANLQEGLPLQNYDAFVLFADDDIDFAIELIDTMEKQYRLKLCVTERDLLGGMLEFEATTKLITDRCNRLIVVVSPAFLKSTANRFFMHFGQSVGIEQQQRKVIPCLCKPCDIPSQLSCYHLLDYNRVNGLYNYWEKLKDSIINVPTSENLAVRQQVGYRNSLPDTFSYRKAAQNNNITTLKNNVKFNSDYTLYTDKSTASVVKTNGTATTSSEKLSPKEDEQKKAIRKGKFPIKLFSTSKKDKESNVVTKCRKFFGKKSMRRKFEVACDTQT